MTVEIDTSKLDKGVRALADDIARKAPDAAVESANAVASRLRDLLPRRTGRLERSVTVSTETDGAAVHYGAGVPYAAYIDGRTGATDDATEGSDRTFHAACTAVAEKAVRAL